MADGQPGYLLVACPECHAGYKIRRDRAARPLTCRSCGHSWTPTVRPADPPPEPTPEAVVAAEPDSEAEAPTKPAEPTPAAEDPILGTELGNFRIQSRIGSGGFGVVYRAFDTNLERSVALKMLPGNLAEESPKLVQRFLREARSAAKLQHPNIVTIHQIVPYKSTFYIVMELVDGGALHEFLAVQRRFKATEATRIIRAAAEGLAHAHRRGVIHRDIKPGNIMMTNDGQVKVSDFGLARDLLQGRDIVGPGHSLGTPRYMAPEQCLGEEPTAASDLYSLASTFFVLLTGRPAFDAPSDRQLMKQQVRTAVPDPRQFVPDLPVAVYRFFQKAMAKQPEDRYVTAEKFIDALDRLDFSGTADSAVPTPATLSAQLGPIAVEDRGSHLSNALGRAVRRGQRVRTPTPLQNAVAGEPIRTPTTNDAGPALSGWKLWVLIGVGLAIVVGGAIAAAIMLAPGGPIKPPPEEPGEPTRPEGTGTPPVEPGDTPGPAEGPEETEPETPPEAPEEGAVAVGPDTPAEAPAEAPDEADEPEDVAPRSPEENAQLQLEDAIRFEKRKNAWMPDIMRAYQAVIEIYPKTKAAEEARKALERLEKGDRLPIEE